MKLLFCGNCGDIFNLVKNTPKACRCGLTGGFMQTEQVAYYHGEHAMPMGFENRSLMDAIVDGPYLIEPTDVKEFKAFTVSPTAETFIKQTTPVKDESLVDHIPYG